MSERLTIEDVSRQSLILGTSCFTDPTGNIGYKTDMVQASATVRIAAALERQTELLEALYHRRDDVRNNGVLTKHGREVGLTFTASSVAMAETLSEQLRQVFALLEQADKEGGLSNG